MMFDPFSDLTDRPARGVLNLLQEGIQTLFHLLLFSLLLLGFGGLIYKALRSGGWVESILGRILAQHPAIAILAPLGALGMAAIGTPHFPYFHNSSILCQRAALLGSC